MTTRPVVVDTNVAVSGLLTADPLSPTARILDGMIAARFRFLLSIELLAEYGDVFLRPRVALRHGLSAEEIDVILTDITAAATVLRPEQLSPRPPGGDGHLWQLLDTVPAAVLVTGDRRLFDSPKHSARVLDPRAFGLVEDERLESLARERRIRAPKSRWLAGDEVRRRLKLR